MSHVIQTSLRLIIGCIITAGGSHLIAAAEPLRMENALPIAPARSGAPIYVTGELQYDLPGILEGRLSFVLRDGPMLVAAVETDPMVVVSGITRFRQLIPISDRAFGYGLSNIEVSFLTDEKRYRLGDIGVKLAQHGSWETVVLCAEPTPGAGLSGAGALQRAVTLGSAFRDATEFGIQSFIPTIAASDFPEQPLAYCVCDLVLLPNEAFKRLSGRQLAAIRHWTRAGGAVCINIDGPCERKQVEFLAELFAETDAGPFVRDETGQLLEPPGAKDRIFASRAGLGHALVTFGPANELDLNGATWRESHARLWRLREKLVDSRRSGQTIDPQTIRRSMTRRSDETLTDASYGAVTNDPQYWGFPKPPFGTAVVEALRPKNIRILPGWIISLILLGYVVIVGPLDYLLLGWLRSRKWTWLTFPTMTLVLTVAVVGATDSFMSDNDHRRHVEIIDLDLAGQPVRSTKLELLFRGSSEPAVHQVARAWFSGLSPSHFQTLNQFGQATSTSNEASTGPYAGMIPSRYLVPQRVAKWTPQVNRTFEIAPDVEVPPIDWEKVQRGSTGPLSLPNGRSATVVRFAEGLESGNGGPLGGLRSADSYGWQNGRIVQPLGELTFYGAATASPLHERYAVQFQRSPLGLGRLDDLSFADQTDSGTAALVVWTQDREGNITAYRKLVDPRE